MVVGATVEIDALCAEMRRRGDGPDFIAVDGKEGGSGAAPLALADYVGLPLVDALNPADKSVRVFNYAMALERDLQMITHACGLEHPSQLTREHVIVNVSPGVRKPLVELFPYPQKSALERPTAPDDSSRRFPQRSRANVA